MRPLGLVQAGARSHTLPNLSQGGLKAVIWTDTFQMAIILGGLLAVVIKATMEVGGVQAVLDVADEHGKINFNK